ncbi:hypothetical protein ACWDT6_23900, partial [Nocardia grenadensis]
RPRLPGPRPGRPGAPAAAGPPAASPSAGYGSPVLGCGVTPGRERRAAGRGRSELALRDVVFGGAAPVPAAGSRPGRRDRAQPGIGSRRFKPSSTRNRAGGLDSRRCGVAVPGVRTTDADGEQR